MINDLIESNLVFWKKKNIYYCAVPRDDIATRMGYSWKTHGIIGSGKTKESARRDWLNFKKSSKIVSDIY